MSPCFHLAFRETDHGLDVEKKKKTIKAAVSRRCKSQPLWYGSALVFMALVTCMKVPWIQKHAPLYTVCIKVLGKHMAPSGPCLFFFLFSGVFEIFSMNMQGFILQSLQQFDFTDGECNWYAWKILRAKMNTYFSAIKQSVSKFTIN